MEKFLTKDNITIAVIVAWMLISSGYFATKLDIAELRNDILTVKSEMQQYSDKKDEAILEKINENHEKILRALHR